MLLPNAHRASVDLAKLRDYCINPEHPRGKHKARVFESALGMTRDDATDLERQLLSSIRTADCTAGNDDAYGRRFFSDFTIIHRGRSATIRSAWIIHRGENFPRLTTCYLL